MSGRAALLLLLVASFFVVGPVAAAQEYGELRGDLEGVPAAVDEGASLPLVAADFAPSAVLDIVLVSNSTGESISLGTVSAADDGSVDTSVDVPAGLAPGAYTLSVTGDAVDGGTRVLSAGLQVGDEAPPVPATSTTVAAEGGDVETAASSDGGSSGGGLLPVLLGGGAVLVAAAGGLVWWRSRAASR